MSFKVFAHVLNLKVGNPTAKLILSGLAEHAHEDGTAAFPSRATLATYAECSDRSVKRHLEYLRAGGFIRYGDQRFVAHLRADRRPVVYDVACTEATQDEWAGQYRNERERGDSIVSPRGARGDKALSPRDKAPAQTRGQFVPPQPRGDKKALNSGHGGTQLCPPNPPIEPSSSPQPPSTGPVGAPPTVAARPEEAEEISQRRTAAAAVVADLPGTLTPGQRHRLAATVETRLRDGWATEALRTELTVDLGDVRSYDAVYRHRLAQLPADPPAAYEVREPAALPLGGEPHVFEPDPEDPGSCRRCPRPEVNRIHTNGSNQISRTDYGEPDYDLGSDGSGPARARSGRRNGHAPASAGTFTAKILDRARAGSDVA